MKLFNVTVSPETEFSGPLPEAIEVRAETKEEALLIACPRFNALMPAGLFVAKVWWMERGRVVIWRRLPFTDWEVVR